MEITTVAITRIYCEMDRKTNLIDDTRLEKSIAKRIEQGLNPLIQAIALHPTDREGFDYEVADGRRRFKALQTLNITELRIGTDATIANGDLEMIAFVANDERLNMTLFEQVEKLRNMLAGNTRTLEELAAELGRSPAWIAKRINLLSLCPTWTKSMKANEFARFTVAHYEAVAAFPHDTQEEIHQRLCTWNGSSYREMSAKKFAVTLHKEYATMLKDLPWEEAGCGTCPMCRERAEGGYLFSDLGKQARCMNRPYIQEKQRQYIAGQIAANEELVAVTSHYTADKDDENAVFSPIGYSEYHRTESKKGVPAILVDGPDAGKIIRIIRTSPASSNTEPQEQRSKTLAERKEQKQKQRQRFAIEKLMAYLESPDCAVPGCEDLYALSACLGLDTVFGYHYGVEEQLPSGIKSFAAAKARTDLDANVWSYGIRGRIAQSLKYGQTGAVPARWEEAEIISELIAFDLAAALAEGTEALPDPKSWAMLEAAEKQSAEVEKVA